MGKCWCTKCEKYVEYKLNRESKDYILDDGKTQTKIEWVRPTCWECGNYVDLNARDPNEKVEVPEKVEFEISKPEASIIYRALKSYVLYSGSFITNTEYREKFETSMTELYDPLMQVERYSQTSIWIDEYQAEHIMYALRNFRLTCAYLYDSIDGFSEIFDPGSAVIRRLENLLHIESMFEEEVTL